MVAGWGRLDGPGMVVEAHDAGTGQTMNRIEVEGTLFALTRTDKSAGIVRAGGQAPKGAGTKVEGDESH